MTQNAPEAPSQAVVEEEVRLAEAQEQAELNTAQKNHLQQRVVTLRVQVNRLQSEVSRLTAALEEATKVPEVEAPPAGTN